MMKVGLTKVILFSVVLLGLSLGVHAEEEGEATVSVQSHYYPLDPAFVTNFGTSQVKLKFLKAEISLKVLGPESLSAVSKHNPMIRHEVVMVLSRQTEESLSSSAGQDAARLQALEQVRMALEEETGSPHVEDLLFTTFVVQR